MYKNCGISFICHLIFGLSFPGLPKINGNRLPPKIMAGILVLIFAVTDILIRRTYIAEFSFEDEVVYSVSLIFEYLLLFCALSVYCRKRVAGSILLFLYIVLVFCSYSFLFYFHTLPGINTFSFLFLSPRNSLSLAYDGLNLFNLLIGIAVFTALITALHKFITTESRFRKGGTALTTVITVALILVLNNNLRLKDNRTLPFTNALFAFRYGYEDYKNTGKLDRLGNRSFSMTPADKRNAGYNVLLIINESLSPYYMSAFGGKYNTDSNFCSFKETHNRNVFTFNKAYSNATVTAVSVPFLTAGLHPAEGMYKLIHSPLLPDILKNSFSNIRTAHISSWSYDDYPDFKNFFNSPSLDYYIYREKINAPKTVDMGTDDTVIGFHFSKFLSSLKRDEHFAATLHFSNTHYPYYPQSKVCLFDCDDANECNYISSLKQLDKNIGNILRDLEQKGQLENTIIISTSDHSESLGRFYPMRGHFGKFNTWNNRVPVWAYIPDKLLTAETIQALQQNINSAVSNNDIIPTLLSVLSVPWSGNGNSLLAPLPAGREIYIYNGKGENRTDSKDYFGLIRNDSLFLMTREAETNSPELYLLSDLMQTTNLWEGYPAKDQFFNKYFSLTRTPRTQISSAH